MPDLADVQVDPIRFRQRLVERVPADDPAQSRLRYPVDRRVHVLGRDHRFHGVDHPEAGDGRHVDAHVGPGDGALGLDGQGDDPQRHPE
jgi:hypothetical protein